MEAAKRAYAKVAVDVPIDSAEVCPCGEFQTFDYRVTADQSIGPGSVLEVPFGPRRVLGFVLEVLDQPSIDPKMIRDVRAAVSSQPLFGTRQVELALWMAQRYLCRPIEALKLMLPPGLKPGRTPFPPGRRYLSPDPNWRERAGELSGAPAQMDVMRTIDGLDIPIGRSHLAKAAGRSVSAVDGLIERGLLRWVREEEGILARRTHAPKTSSHALTAAQNGALAAVSSALATAGETVLLHGVTGSGKTEVYLRAVAQVLEEGGGALILVPEISLTPQMVDRVRERLDEDVALLHSSLSVTERARTWQRLWRGEVRVALGPRSVVFAPCSNLSLIVLDEEHETSYKQDTSPRYHAREVARARAKIEGATVILGSATPSLESYHKAATDRYVSLQLPTRIGGGDPPLPRLVDMRDERRNGNRSVFSEALHRALRERLRLGEQSLLFLNQRGYSSFIMCPDCGNTVRCEKCSVTMTYHRDGTLRCHYCGALANPPELCPVCGGHNLARRGLGTQKVEAAVHAAFPGARVRRMDTDSVRRRGTREAIYRAFVAGEIDVLVGTQMITKGWDIPRVSLVGIIDADTALHLPDFRGAERTFQLVTQVSGRCGRGSIPGEVIVQTWNPDHPALEAARMGDLAGFYLSELDARAEARYPPFVDLVRIIVRGEELDRVVRFSHALVDRLRPLARAGGEILGPASAPLERIRGES
ncbi:MAG: primosomal protein N', partial [Clostridia bacterium]